MNRLQLPIGDSSFRNLRTSGCYYADKYRTLGQEIHRLALVFDQEQRQLAACPAEWA